MNLTAWRNVEKQNNPKIDEFIIKVEHFSYDNILQDFKFMKSIVKIVMDVWWNSKWKESVDKKKDS